MLVEVLESGQISATVGPHASREPKSCPQHWLSIFPELPELSLNFFFRSFLRKRSASFPYEKACYKTLHEFSYTGAKIIKYRATTRSRNKIIHKH